MKEWINKNCLEKKTEQYKSKGRHGPLDKLIREGLSEKVAFQLRPIRQEHIRMRRLGGVPGRSGSECQGPEAEITLEDWQGRGVAGRPSGSCCPGPGQS